MSAPAAVRPAPPVDPALAAGAAWIEGEIVPIAEARIPLTDTGFTRSDLTYDVVSVWKGSFFRLDQHLARFERGNRKLRLNMGGLTQDELRAILHDLVARTGLRDSYVSMTCTRGVPPAGSRDPREFRNRLYLYAIPFVWLLTWEDRDTGMPAILAKSVERISPRAVDPTVKNFHWGDLTASLFEAYDAGARFSVLLGADGYVTEGPGYNVFAWVDGELLTPDAGALEGITRLTTMEIARAQGIPVREARIDEATFRRADELFACTTAGGIMAITSLDGKPLGDGTAGPLTRRLRDLFWEAHGDPRYSEPIAYAD